MLKFFDQTLPPVHVLMPAYNAASFIKSALASVSQQVYPTIKIIILDDGSTDKTLLMVKQYLEQHPKMQDKLYLQQLPENQGVARARKKLLQISKALNPNAYIFWLDADDQYIEKDFIYLTIKQMKKTRADICVFNFAIIYEDERQRINAAGLLRDQANSQRIVESIYLSPGEAVSPLEVDILKLTSLGWIKCYAPTVNIPEAVDCPFEDFVMMATLLFVNKITALPPEKKPIQYLRRSTSICGQRSPENFTQHIPAQLKRFFETVCENIHLDPDREKKLAMAVEFVNNKLEQYSQTLSTLVESHVNTSFNLNALGDYKSAAESLREFIRLQLLEAKVVTRLTA
ncbi:MAG: glycosyl transferase family 2 [Gammaproteobacteria bacterium]|jgi:glycosyltransferase involved in cell wall biosynthesis|nr:glycosyl transferase family 2 [Gammaproteobacteria bacterium]